MVDLNSITLSSLLTLSNQDSTESELVSLTEDQKPDDDTSIDFSAFVNLFTQILAEISSPEQNESEESKLVHLDAPKVPVRVDKELTDVPLKDKKELPNEFTLDSNIAVAWIDSEYHQAELKPEIEQSVGLVDETVDLIEYKTIQEPINSFISTSELTPQLTSISMVDDSQHEKNINEFATSKEQVTTQNDIELDIDLINKVQELDDKEQVKVSSPLQNSDLIISNESSQINDLLTLDEKEPKHTILFQNNSDMEEELTQRKVGDATLREDDVIQQEELNKLENQPQNKVNLTSTLIEFSQEYTDKENDSVQVDDIQLRKPTVQNKIVLPSASIEVKVKNKEVEAVVNPEKIALRHEIELPAPFKLNSLEGVQQLPTPLIEGEQSIDHSALPGLVTQEVAHDDQPGFKVNPPKEDFLLNMPSSYTISTDVDHPQWPTQFYDQVLWLGQQGIKSAIIKLHPEDLGPLEISISVVNDVASLTITSHSQQVRELIDQSLPKLHEMMIEQGINLSEVTIDSSAEDRHFEQKHYHYSENLIDLDEQNNTLTPIKNRTAKQGIIDFFA